MISPALLMGLLAVAISAVKTTVALAMDLPSGATADRLADRTRDERPHRFALRPAEETGIDFRHTWNPPRKYYALIDGAFVGGGVAIGDIDGDGKPDVYLSRPFGGGQLYRNLGAWKFENATAKAGLAGDANRWGSGCTMADIDNDGDLDLSVCGYDPNRIFLNDGRGVFTEAAAACGLDFTGASIIFSWADYDSDGDLDAYLVTNRWNTSEAVSDQTKAQLAALERKLTKDSATGRFRFSEELREDYDVVERADGKPILVNSGQRDRLYRNDGPGPDGRPHFTDVTRGSGVWDYGRGLSATWWDYDADGRADLYVANDFYAPDRLWHNNGDGTFTDKAPDLLPHTPWFSMGSDAGDLNNDGWLDFIASDMAGSTHYKEQMNSAEIDQNGWFLEVGKPRQEMRNAVFLNSGRGLPFMEIAHLTGFAATDWTWAVKLGDLDCDGWLDLYITNGMSGDYLNPDLRAAIGPGGGSLKNSPPKKDLNMAFRNLGGLAFESVGQAWGLERESVSFGAAYGDLDGDGDLDLVVNNYDEAPSIYENIGADGERIAVRLVGTRSNRGGVGAAVTAKAGDLTVTRYLNSARGFASSDEPLLHFGLGKQQKIDQLTIQWPGGAREVYRDLPAGQLYTFTEGRGQAASPVEPAPPPMFARRAALNDARHRERTYHDFVRQPLLPGKMSQLGPAFAWGDIDGDGDDDLFQGGAAGFSGTLMMNAGDGTFQPKLSAALETARESEDMGALFFEADGDGDLDLFVVSGGVEAESDSSLFQDRLYLNDGSGRFTASFGAIPRERDSGSAVCAADFDRDGDLDLFVGGRVVPGEYPLSPGSRILRNDGGKFADATDQVASSLADPEKGGRVTAATWSDVDCDGWIDLLITTEWGPVRVWRNQNGSLHDISSAAGTDVKALRGWWNGIASGDLDGDGDMDFVATNLGLNTKYQPAKNRPAHLYFGDLDGTGSPQIVEAKTTVKGELLPIRGKISLQQAMPSLGEKFPTHAGFASATLDTIFSRELLDNAQHFETEMIESGIFWNETQEGGPARLVFEPLPRLAQIAPSFGAQIVDVNLDGVPDIYVVQNIANRQRETGRMDGGVSLLLLGRGGRRFEPVWPDVSGLAVAGEAKSVTICDFNQDRRPDFVVGINDSAPVAFENQTRSSFKPLVIRLRGPVGNPTAIGARVSLRTSSGKTIVREAHAGSGYLSQSSGDLFIALPPGDEPKSAEVRWPDGNRSSWRGAATAGIVVIEQRGSTKQKPR